MSEVKRKSVNINQDNFEYVESLRKEIASLKSELANKDMEIYKLKDADDEICRDNALLKSEIEHMKANGKEVADAFWKERMREDRFEEALKRIVKLVDTPDRKIGDYSDIAKEALRKCKQFRAEGKNEAK